MHNSMHSYKEPIGQQPQSGLTACLSVPVHRPFRFSELLVLSFAWLFPKHMMWLSGWLDWCLFGVRQRPGLWVSGLLERGGDLGVTQLQLCITACTARVSLGKGQPVKE